MENIQLASVSSDTSERRDTSRQSTEFYAVELDGDARYLRRVRNVSRDGLLVESPLAFQSPGEEIELELPRLMALGPLRIKAKVVRLTDGGMGLQKIEGQPPLIGLGGNLAL